MQVQYAASPVAATPIRSDHLVSGGPVTLVAPETGIFSSNISHRVSLEPVLGEFAEVGIVPFSFSNPQN